MAGKALGDAYTWNNFPHMRVVWNTYPNHIGHQQSPGCFRCHDNKHKTDTAAIKALKAKGVSITSSNCTRFRQFRAAIDEVKAYKFLYGCASPWRDVRDLLPKDVFLNAFKQFQTDFPDDFANFQ